MKLKPFPPENQYNAKDCGPTCLKIIAKYYGRYYSLQYLRDLCGINKEGVSMLDISYAAKEIGLRTTGISCTMQNFLRIPLPFTNLRNGLGGITLLKVLYPTAFDITYS